MRRISIFLLSWSAFCLVTACTAKKEKPRGKPPVPVTVVQAVHKEVPLQVKAIGTIEAFTSVAIKAQVSGQIARIHFAEGSDVAKGALLVSMPDNVLRPLIIGRKAKLPTFLLFLGILGGLQAYGMLGILFGPLVVTLLTSFVAIYREEFADEN